MGVPAIDCLSAFPSNNPPGRAPPITTATTALVGNLRIEDPMPMDIDVDYNNEAVANTIIPAFLQVQPPCEFAPVIISKKRRRSMSPSKEMELAQPRIKRSCIPLVKSFAAQLFAGIEAILDSDDDGDFYFEDNRHDDQMDILFDLTPTLSIPAGEAREVTIRETSTKGRRLRKELESSLDGRYWVARLAAWR